MKLVNKYKCPFCNYKKELHLPTEEVSMKDLQEFIGLMIETDIGKHIYKEHKDELNLVEVKE